MHLKVPSCSEMPFMGYLRGGEEVPSALLASEWRPGVPGMGGGWKEVPTALVLCQMPLGALSMTRDHFSRCRLEHQPSSEEK